MALTQRLEFRQSHALVMTPQLMQAIKLLQLSNMDLTTYVEGELERNPLLERATDGSDGRPAAEEQAKTADVAPPVDAGAADWMNTELETSRGTIEERLDTSLDNVFPDEGDTTSARHQAETV